MPKMMTKCTTCGAILAVDSASHKEVCPYCGWSFTVVPVKGAVSPGAQPGPSKNYPEAIRQLTALANEAPDRFEVWWGLARYYTSDFSTTVFTDSGYKKASLAIENACRTSSAANRAKIEAVWKRYTADYLKDRSKKQNQVRPLHQLLAV